MSRVRIGLLVAAMSAAMVVSGCEIGVPPLDVTPSPTTKPTPPPTEAVDVSGSPIMSLCDLLAASDITTVVGIGATPPAHPAPGLTAGTVTECDYAPGVDMTVRIGAGQSQANAMMQDVVRALALTAPTSGLIGGVDASEFGATAHGSAIVVQRRSLVISITLPSVAGIDMKVSLTRLVATVLSRVNTLGT
jgi:hypothetical protein